MAAPRYVEKFTSLDGSTTVYTFSLKGYEWEPAQSLRSPAAGMMGASYAFRMLGTNPALKALGTERIRALAVETSFANLEAEIDEMRSELFKIGLGKLWTLDSAGARRWSYAECTEMPSVTISAGSKFAPGVVFSFTRYSDWLGETAITHTETVTASPDTFVVANPGNMPATIVEIRLRSNTTGGITDPLIENTTAVSTPFGSVLYTFQSTRDSTTANDELRLFTGSPEEPPSVKWSTDNGSNYADDFANLVIPSAHRVLSFALAPGNNSIRATIGGTENVDVEIEAWAPYA